MSQPTRVGMTIGSTSRNGGEFEFRKITLSLERDLALAENPVDAYRDINLEMNPLVSVPRHGDCASPKCEQSRNAVTMHIVKEETGKRTPPTNPIHGPHRQRHGHRKTR